MVRRSIDECGIDPALIELEIHEATAMRDVGLTVELFKLIRDVGVSVAIDDFGSAHSSLGSLRVLPINAVKIDRGLVEHVATAAADAAIVDAVIAVSEGTRKEVLECYELDPARVRVIHNGIDLDIFRREDPKPAHGAGHGFTGCGYSRDTGSGSRGLDVLRVRWEDAAREGFCVMPLDRFLEGL